MALEQSVRFLAGAALAAVTLEAGACGHGSIDLFPEQGGPAGGAGGDLGWQEVGGGEFGSGGWAAWRNTGGSPGGYDFCNDQQTCRVGLVCTDPNKGWCKQCTANKTYECDELGLVCDPGRMLCVSCYGNQGCHDEGTVCDSIAGVCRAFCSSDLNCGPAMPYCNWSGLCVECWDDDQCRQGLHCISGMCGDCYGDENCRSQPSRPYCSAGHMCVECITHGHCPSDQYYCDRESLVCRLRGG